MDENYLLHDGAARIERINKTLVALDKELFSMNVWFDELGRDMDAVNARLRELKQRKTVVSGAPAPEERPGAAVPDDNFKMQMEKLLQGSLEHLEDRLSNRILNMLKELKVTSGPARDVKLKELKEAVDSEVVDLSGLFMFEKLESNIGQVGVVEKESKGIQAELERLRRLRDGTK